MIKALAHVCFVVSDLEASLAFYQDTLGLTHAFDFRNQEGERTGVYLHLGGRSFLELFRGELGARAEGQSYAHLCLEVADVAATVEELRSKGVEVTEAVLGGDRSWQAWLADPDGNRIELHGYTAQSRQGPWVG
jgi:catechol 2,3-dioxygenase-like lactoylglutathione lyase family enzyme